MFCYVFEAFNLCTVFFFFSISIVHTMLVWIFLLLPRRFETLWDFSSNCFFIFSLLFRCFVSLILGDKTHTHFYFICRTGSILSTTFLPHPMRFKVFFTFVILFTLFFHFLFCFSPLTPLYHCGSLSLYLSLTIFLSITTLNVRHQVLVVCF